jgi:hypothetical protein
MDALGTEARPDHVIDLRLRRDARAELEWYFQLAETEMSAPSNFGRMLASVGPRGYWRTPEDQAEAAIAHRRVLGWLRAMPNNEAGVLQAAYEPRDWPRAVRIRFGHLSGIAVRLTCSLDAWPEDRRLQEAMDKARAQDLAAMCTHPQEQASFLDRLRAQAEERFERAVAAYLRARGTGRAVIPSHAWGARLTTAPRLGKSR